MRTANLRLLWILRSSLVIIGVAGHRDLDCDAMGLDASDVELLLCCSMIWKYRCGKRTLLFLKGWGEVEEQEVEYWLAG